MKSHDYCSEQNQALHGDNPAGELCYTGTMQIQQKEWQTWAQKLHQWHISEPAAALLEGAGPLTVILAQCLYFSQPFFKNRMPSTQWEALAEILEEEEQSRLFAAFLRQEDNP